MNMSNRKTSGAISRFAPESLAERIRIMNTENPANLSLIELEDMIAKTDATLHSLRDVYRVATGDESLMSRCFTAAKAIERLQYGLKGRWNHLSGIES